MLGWAAGRAKLLSAGVLAATALLAGSDVATVMRETNAPGVLDEAIILAPSRFAPAVIEATARQYLKENAKRSILRLTMAPDREILARTLSKGPSDTTFQSLQEDVARLGLPKGPVAQLFSVGGAAILVYKDVDGYTEKPLAGTRDPRVLQEAGVEFRLLHFRIQEKRQSPVERTPQEYVTSFFFEVHGDISVGACAAITKQIAILFRMPYSTATFHAIPWFVEDPGFPDIFPFVDKILVPSKWHYFLLPSVGCTEHPRSGLRCSGQNFVP
jgi:hypothetical protein